MKKASISILAGLLSACLLLSACGAGAQAEEQQEEAFVACGDGFNLSAQGDHFVLDLASNPTTGFTWVVLEQDPALRLDGEEYIADQTDKPVSGSGGTSRFSFTALEAGDAAVTLEYKRPWEGGETAARGTLHVKISRNGESLQIRSADFQRDPVPVPVPTETVAPPLVDSAALPERIGLSGGDIALIDALAEQDSSVFVSPLSIDMALAMLLNGADGTSREALAAYLKTDADTANTLAYQILRKARESQQAAAEWSSNQNRYGLKPSELLVANSFWYSADQQPESAFVETLRSYYEAEVGPLDLADPAAAETINAWVAEKTRGLIDRIVTPEALSGMADVLVNTVYFNGLWVDELAAGHEAVFHGRNGEQSAQLMGGEADAYLENDRAVGFVKNYMNGYRFVGILPKAEGDFTLSQLDLPDLLESESREYDVTVQIPKFEFSYDSALKEPLSALGLADLFSDKADLSGIAPELQVSEILHKTTLKMQEEGTEAAAVTAVMVAAGAMLTPREQKSVILDRPFVGLIQDADHNTLFVLKLTDLP